MDATIKKIVANPIQQITRYFPQVIETRHRALRGERHWHVDNRLQRNMEARGQHGKTQQPKFRVHSVLEIN